MERIFGIFSLGLGFYCLYGFYMLKFKNEINELLMTPRNTEKKKCKDFEGFRNMVQWPLLALGIIVIIYGVVDLYNIQNGGYDTLFLIMLLLSAIALMVYAAVISKANKKFF